MNDLQYVERAHLREEVPDFRPGDTVKVHVRVVEGGLHYHVDAPVHRSFPVAADSGAVIVPEVRHRVEPEGAVRFFIEFARVRPARKPE